MTTNTIRPPATEEQKAKVRVLYQRGISGRQIARDVDLSPATVYKIIANSAARTVAKAPPKQAAVTQVFNRHAEADYSQAIVTRHVFVPHTASPICNAASTALYCGSELRHRSMK